MLVEIAENTVLQLIPLGSAGRLECREGNRRVGEVVRNGDGMDLPGGRRFSCEAVSGRHAARFLDDGRIWAQTRPFRLPYLIQRINIQFSAGGEEYSFATSRASLTGVSECLTTSPGAVPRVRVARAGIFRHEIRAVCLGRTDSRLAMFAACLGLQYVWPL